MIDWPSYNKSLVRRGEILFSNEEWRWYFSFRNLQERGYHVPPSVETGCFPWILTMPERNLSDISMFLSLDMDSARICLFSGSIATTQIQMYSEPTLICVSSTMYSDNLFFLGDIFYGWCFWIQFQMETWFLLTKQANLSEARLNDNPEKYKYKP